MLKQKTRDALLAVVLTAALVTSGGAGLFTGTSSAYAADGDNGNISLTGGSNSNSNENTTTSTPDSVVVENTTSIPDMEDGNGSVTPTTIAPYKDVTFTFTAKGPSARAKGTTTTTDSEGNKNTTVDSEGLSYLEFTLQNPNSSVFTFKNVTVKMEGTDANGKSVSRNINGQVSCENGIAKFVVNGSELGTKGEALDSNENILYNDETFTFSVTASTPQDLSALGDSLSLNKDVVASVTYSVDPTQSLTSMKTVSSKPFTNSADVAVAFPSLNVAVSADSPTAQNAFYTIKRTITVTNGTAAAPATGIEISDTQKTKEGLSNGVSYKEGSITVTNGDKVLTEGTDYKISTNSNDISISLSDDVQVISGKSLVITYDLILGKKDAEFTMGKLANALSGGSTVKVTANNVKESTSYQAGYSKLLQPSIAITQSIESTKSFDGSSNTYNGENNGTLTLTKDETAHVVITLDTSKSDDGTKLINPKITMSSTMPMPENVKVNGKSYEWGELISDGTDTSSENAPGIGVKSIVSKGSKIILEYDVTAGSTNSSGNVTTTLSADNLDNGIDATVSFTYAIPSVTVTVAPSTEKPSAKDEVTVSATGTVKDAEATGMVLVVEDEAASGTATSKKFQEPSLTSNKNTKLTAGTDYKIYTTDNSISAWFTGKLQEGEIITLVYKDVVADDYKANGVTETLSARFTQNSTDLAKELGLSSVPSAWSNLPESASASASYTVQTPSFAINTSVVDPVNEDGTPAVINFGDSVSYKTTLQQLNPDAKGNDMVYTAKIADVVVGATEETDDTDTATDDETATTDSTDDEQSSTSKSGTSYTAAEIGLSLSDAKVMQGETDVTDQYTIEYDENSSSFTVKMKDLDDAAVKAAGLTYNNVMSNEPIYILFTLNTGSISAKYADQLRGVDITVDSSIAVSNLESAVAAVGNSTVTVADSEIKLTKSASSAEVYRGEVEQYTLKVENTFTDATTGELDPDSQIRGLTVTDTIDSYAAQLGYKLVPGSFKVELSSKASEVVRDYKAGEYTVGEDIAAGTYDIAFDNSKTYPAGTYKSTDFTAGEYKITFKSDDSDSDSSPVQKVPAETVEYTDDDASMSSAQVNDVTSGQTITIAGPSTTTTDGTTATSDFTLTADVEFTLTPVEDTDPHGTITRADQSTEDVTDGEIKLDEGDVITADLPFSLAQETVGQDITDSEAVQIVPTEDLTSFTFTYDEGLSTAYRLTITYQATTENISEDAYSETLGNYALASANNAKPSGASENVLYVGQDLPIDPVYYSGTVSTGGATIASTGDITLYVIVGVLACSAIAAGVVFFMRRQRER